MYNWLSVYAFCLGLYVGLYYEKSVQKHADNTDTLRLRHLTFCNDDRCDYDMVVQNNQFHIRGRDGNGNMVPRYTIMSV